MTLATFDVLQLLPALRRYACALTGSAQSGDEYIRVTLESLAVDHSERRAVSAAKPRLYDLFHRALDACHFEADGPLADPSSGLDIRRQILQLPLLSRKILLLVMLEGFSVASAAKLVGLRECELKFHLDAALDYLRQGRRRRDGGSIAGLRELWQLECIRAVRHRN